MQRYGRRMQQRCAAVLQFQVLARRAKLPDAIARGKHMERLAYALNTVICKALLCYDEQLKAAKQVQILAAYQELGRRAAACLVLDN